MTLIQIKTSKWVAVAILTACFAVGIPGYMSTDSPFLLRATTYHWFHANIFHLAVNCLSLSVIFRNGVRIRELSWAFLMATVSYAVAVRPIVGISNILFAVIGMRTPSFDSPWWRNPATLTFLAVTLLMVFIPQVSATTHIFSFTMGVLYAYLKRHFNSIYDDYRRAGK